MEKILSKVQEMVMWTLFQMTGSDKYRDRVILSSRPMCYQFAEKYRHRGVQYQDLFDAAEMGLCVAANGFDHQRATSKFSSYAYHFMRGEIIKLFKANNVDVQYTNVENFEPILDNDEPNFTHTTGDLHDAIVKADMSDELKKICFYRIIGHSFEEIGDKLGISKQNVNKKYHKAIKIIIKGDGDRNND